MSDELVKTLRELADFDARSGEPLGRCMRTAADVIEELIEERDALSAACGKWAEVSQSNYQRAKAAEAQLAQRDAQIVAIREAHTEQEQWLHKMDAALKAADGLAVMLENCLEVLTKEDARLCCDGRECGCYGATKHQEAGHYATEALSAYRKARGQDDTAH